MAGEKVMKCSLHNFNMDWRQTSGTGAVFNFLNFVRKLSILFITAVVFLMAGTSFSAEDESLRSGDKVETRGPNPDHVEAINKMADYLDKMGSKDVGDKLRADFKSGKVYIGKLDANAEVNPGVLGLGRSMAISDAIITQTGTKGGFQTPESIVASWTLTVFHEYVHMKQWMPMEDSSHETPAWGATLKENGQWIRKTLDESDRVGRDTSLSPQERVKHLQELNQTLKALKGVFDVTLNELRDKVAKGDLDKDYEWQGVPPVGSREAKGTTDIDAVGKYADLLVQAGKLEADRQIAEAKKGNAGAVAKSGANKASPAPAATQTLTEKAGEARNKMAIEAQIQLMKDRMRAAGATPENTSD